MQQSFFDVTPVELGQLGSEPAVTVLREMLWAEVNNLGIPISDTDIPFAVNDADGGVDAVVKGIPNGTGNGLIFAPTTSYQVKAGDFLLSATRSAQIEELLMTPNAIRQRINAKASPAGTWHKPEGISPRVRACLDAGGTFVTMLFGSDGVDIEEGATENAIRRFLGEIDPKYKDAKVKVWRQSRICGFLRRFPGVSLQIKNRADLGLLSYDQWTTRLDMRQPFVAAPDQQKVMESLRAAIRDDSRGMADIRLIGEPGVGKTRLILETLRAKDLKPLILYAEKGSDIIGAVMTAVRSANNARVILVVDECSPDVRSFLTRSFGASGPSLTIVSIYQDEEDGDRSSEYRLFAVPRLPNEEIETILKSYGVDPANAKGWAELCDGSPRVAHVVGQNLHEHSDDPLRGDGVSRIWARYLAGDVEQTSDEYKRRHLVLSSMALFKRFGWSAAVSAGTYEVFDLIISKLNPGLSKADFIHIINQMVRRKILQGDHVLYITPRALHIRLWIDWWSDFGAAIKMIDLLPTLSEQIRQWFAEMIEYAHATPVAKKLVADILGPKGLYADAEWLKTRAGGRFFFSLSLADPPIAVRLLQRTIGHMARDELLQFTEGRRDVIWALENMALHGDLFRPAAELLLALAEAENETWSNNASGVFASLFSLGYGEVAPSGLAPEHRLPILIKALAQGGFRGELALKGFDAALNMHSISRWGGDQPFRLNERVQRWVPKTYGEWFEAYKLYWTTLRATLQKSPELRRGVADILLSHVRELLGAEYLHDEILDTVSEIAAYPDIDKRKVISSIELVLNYDKDGLPKDVVSKLTAVRDSLIGTSFSSRLKRYAGLNLLQDQIGRDGNETDKTADDIRQLVREALADPDLLKNELDWLVTEEARNGYRFGHALGHHDVDNGAWPNIVTAWQVAGEIAHDYFIGGYLRAIFERDVGTWEKVIHDLATCPTNLKYLAALVWRSGMTDDIAALLLHLGKAAKFSPETLGIFSTGGTSTPISDGLFGQWLDFLVGADTFKAAAASLNLASMSLLSGRQLSPDQIKKIISQPALFAHTRDRADVMLTHYWFELARTLIKVDAHNGPFVLKVFLENIGSSGTITASLGPDNERYLDELVSQHPVETWRILSEMITPPMDTRAFAITRWLRGGIEFSGRNLAPMRHIPREEIWKWIEAEPEKRGAYIASTAPKNFELETWRGSLVREVLCRFGDSDVIQGAVFANFLTGGWSGPASLHYTTEKGALVQMRASETDPNALRWLNEAIRATDANIERAKIEEEARGY
jgi:hypothetical protein